MAPASPRTWGVASDSSPNERWTGSSERNGRAAPTTSCGGVPSSGLHLTQQEQDDLREHFAPQRKSKPRKRAEG